MSNAFFPELWAVKELISTALEPDAKLSAIEPHLKDTDVAREFWCRLASEDLLKALTSRGYFINPARPSTDKYGGSHTPIWPPAKYLARIAANQPAAVSSILHDLKTENYLIISDMIDAAMKMPAEYAAIVAPAISRAARDGTIWFLYRKAIDLCIRLATEQEYEASLDLADALFRPQDRKTGERRLQGEQHWFDAGLRELVPILTNAEPETFLPQMCEWLEGIIKARHQDPNNPDWDYSYIWRPAIEEDEANQRADIDTTLAGFIRLGFETAIEEGSLQLKRAFEFLGRFKFLIYRRLEFYLLNKFAPIGDHRVVAEILKKENFNNPGIRHEWAMLVRKRFEELSSGERTKWIEAVDADSDEILRCEKLNLIREHLDKDHLEFCDRVEKEWGARSADSLRPPISGHWFQPRSPMTLEELSAMSFEQTVERVAEWQPKPGFEREEKRSALASVFGEYVATNPVSFSSESAVLKEKPLVFVQSFLSQMATAAKDKQKFDLTAILDLCGWVVESTQSTGSGGESDTDGSEPDSMNRDARNTVRELLTDLCRASDDGRPHYQATDELRERVWTLIETMQWDSTESGLLDGSEKQDPRTQDFVSRAINSARGQIVGTVFDYARWVANSLKEKQGEQEVIPGGFGSMPEVRSLLEAQIAPGKATVVAMAVIGSNLGLLYWIDRGWLESNLNLLFPLSDKTTETNAPQWSCWNAFLIWTRPHKVFFDLFKDQYRCAVKVAAKIKAKTDRSDRNPLYRLGEHLVLLYGWSDETLDKDSVLSAFMDAALPETRRHAIGFIGEAISRDPNNDPIDRSLLERLQTLWDFYWEHEGKKDVVEKPNAMLFAPWFESGKFDDKWSLSRLKSFTDITKLAQPEFRLAEQLRVIYRKDLAASIAILGNLFEGDTGNWGMHDRIKAAEEILKAAMLQDSAGIREQAREVINLIGRRGYLEIGELLKLYPDE
jgi:hypothetical protein